MGGEGKDPSGGERLACGHALPNGESLGTALAVGDAYMVDGPSEKEKWEEVGTSFFVNFHPFCKAHQSAGPEGDAIRMRICADVEWGFRETVRIRTQDEEIVAAANACRSGIAWRRQEPANNGEVFLWLRSIYVPPMRAYEIAAALHGRLRTAPIRVPALGSPKKEVQVRFCGFGVRYLPSARTLGHEP